MSSPTSNHEGGENSLVKSSVVSTSLPNSTTPSTPDSYTTHLDASDHESNDESSEGSIDNSGGDSDDDSVKGGRPRPQGMMAYRSNALNKLKKEVAVKKSRKEGGSDFNDEMDDDEASEDDEGPEDGGENNSDQENWTSRPFRTPNQAHKPAEKGNWKLAEGTDTTKAVLGKPDPAKFFILRQDQDDLGHFDVREYTYIRNFDWNKNSHIDALNKSRSQIFERTNPGSFTSRPQWSQKEKDVLEELIKVDLLSGKDELTLDWKDIAQRLSQAFVDVKQKVGEPLAQTHQKVNGGAWGPPKKLNPKLKQARSGPIQRSATAVRLQAFKFRSISELLDKYPGTPKSKRGLKKRKTIASANVHDAGQAEVDSSSEAGTQLKKQKVVGGKAKLQAETDALTVLSNEVTSSHEEDDQGALVATRTRNTKQQTLQTDASQENSSASK